MEPPALQVQMVHQVTLVLLAIPKPPALQAHPAHQVQVEQPVQVAPQAQTELPAQLEPQVTAANLQHPAHQVQVALQAHQV